MNRSAYDRFKSDENPPEPDKAAFEMGVTARHNGGSLRHDPFKPGGWLSKSWRAGWCDEDQALNEHPTHSDVRSGNVY